MEKYMIVLSCVQLFATPWTIISQAPLPMRFSQARIFEWVAMPSSRDLSDTGIKLASPAFPALAHGFFTTSTTLGSLFRQFAFNLLFPPMQHKTLIATHIT